MPKTSSNEIVRQHQERRRELILECSRFAAEHIAQAKKRPATEEIATLIAEKFLAFKI